MSKSNKPINSFAFYDYFKKPPMKMDFTEELKKLDYTIAELEFKDVDSDKLIALESTIEELEYEFREKLHNVTQNIAAHMRTSLEDNMNLSLKDSFDRLRAISANTRIKPTVPPFTEEPEIIKQDRDVFRLLYRTEMYQTLISKMKDATTDKAARLLIRLGFTKSKDLKSVAKGLRLIVNGEKDRMSKGSIAIIDEFDLQDLRD